MVLYSPYGITLFVPPSGGTPPLLPAQTITDLAGGIATRGLHGGHGPTPWLRYQLEHASIEQTQGVFTWTNFDDALDKCIAAGVPMCWNYQSPPDFYRTVDPSTGLEPGGTNSNWLPNKTVVATFMQIVAARYNGSATNPLTGSAQTPRFLPFVQIGNEDWDSSAPRDSQGTWLADVVAVAFPAIRAVSPNAIIGINAVRKTPSNALTHIINWLTNLYSRLRLLGFVPTGRWAQDGHYYRDGTTDWDGRIIVDPTIPTYQSFGGAINAPDIGLEIQTMKSVAATYGYFPEVMIGECGWNIANNTTDTYGTDTNVSTPAQYAQYMLSMYKEARKNGASFVFMYTMRSTSQESIITIPPAVGLPAIPTLASTQIKSITQTDLNGNYVYLDPYAATQQDAAQFPVWSMMNTNTIPDNAKRPLVLSHFPRKHHYAKRGAS